MISLYGIKSELKPSGLHLVMADIDSTNPVHISEVNNYFTAKLGPRPAAFYRTKHGFHYIFWCPLEFSKVFHLLEECPHIDKHWLKIGLRRGYWFLWTRHAIIPPVSFRRIVQFMKLHAYPIKHNQMAVSNWIKKKEIELTELNRQAIAEPTGSEWPPTSF